MTLSGFPFKVIGGILLGPSFCWRFFPGFSQTVFPASSLTSLNLIANIGTMMPWSREGRRKASGGGRMSLADPKSLVSPVPSQSTTTGLVLYLFLVGIEMDPVTSKYKYPPCASSAALVSKKHHDPSPSLNPNPNPTAEAAHVPLLTQDSWDDTHPL